MNIIKGIIKKKNLIFEKKNIISIFIILLLFFVDRYSKIKVINEYSESSIFINNFINFDLIWNTGIGFGLLSTSTSLIYLLITILIGIVILVIFYTALISKKSDNYIFSIITGGALGNFYDRLAYSAVPDFIDFHLYNFHWFTFNVADIFVTFGIIIFFLKSLLIKD
jgi:signal peptidase II|tara:strand:- start:25 stop:525 length:501 start_codon:yes stop_codon:yes gene_type:complete